MCFLECTCVSVMGASSYGAPKVHSSFSPHYLSVKAIFLRGEEEKKKYSSISDHFSRRRIRRKSEENLLLSLLFATLKKKLRKQA